MPPGDATHRRRTVAVVLAGGLGARVGADVPKQLLEVGGRSILDHAVTAFQEHPRVDEIVVVMAAGHLDAARRLVARRGHHKVVAVVEGGATRSESSLVALRHVGDGDGLVLLHDAARPLVTARVIDACLDALEEDRAVVVAVPAADTIVEVGADAIVTSVPPRAGLRRVQTPQGFWLPVLREAYAAAAADPGFAATDDASVVLRYLPGVPVRVVAGDERNLKVTDPVDVVVAEHLLREQP